MVAWLHAERAVALAWLAADLILAIGDRRRAMGVNGRLGDLPRRGATHSLVAAEPVDPARLRSRRAGTDGAGAHEGGQPQGVLARLLQHSLLLRHPRGQLRVRARGYLVGVR